MWHRVSTALPVAASTGHQSAQIGRQAPLDFLIALLNCVGCTTSICLLELLANVFVGLLPSEPQLRAIERLAYHQPTHLVHRRSTHTFLNHPAQSGEQPRR